MYVCPSRILCPGPRTLGWWLPWEPGLCLSLKSRKGEGSWYVPAWCSLRAGNRSYPSLCPQHPTLTEQGCWLNEGWKERREEQIEWKVNKFVMRTKLFS